MDYRAAIAEAILVLRRRAGWNQKELARRSGVGASQLSRYELAKKWVSLPVLLQITGALGLSLSQFFRFAEEAARRRSRAGGDRYPANDPGGEEPMGDVAEPDPPIEYPSEREEGGGDE